MKYQLDKTYTDKDVVCITMHAMMAIKPKLIYSGKEPEILKAIENLTDTLKRRANPSFMEVPCCTNPAIRTMYESACMRGKDQLKNFINSEVMKSALNWESILGSDTSILDSETDKVLDILKEKMSYESLSDEVRNAIDSAFTDIHVSTEYAVVSVAPASKYMNDMLAQRAVEKLSLSEEDLENIVHTNDWEKFKAYYNITCDPEEKI